MRTLHLLRHAKSSWGEPELADHDRPLSGRGQRAAAQLGDYLRRSGYRPQLVVCSSALRARQTLDLVAAGLGLDVAVRVDEQVYGASASNLWTLVRELPADVDEAMVVGHNPAMHELASDLATEGEDKVRALLQAKLPTGGLVTLVWAADSWAALRRGSGALHGFVRPRDL
jgi:phosphohistidine phosphatase